MSPWQSLTVVMLPVVGSAAKVPSKLAVADVEGVAGAVDLRAVGAQARDRALLPADRMAWFAAHGRIAPVAAC